MGKKKDADMEATATPVRKPSVIIIGGGYGGIQAAKVLDNSKLFAVTVVDKNAYFTHSMAALRTAVKPQWADNVVLDSTKLLVNGGKVLVGTVVSVDTAGQKVRTADGLELPYDYLVIATGVQTNFPARSPAPATQLAKQLYGQYYTALQKAKNITIVGGGPVGIELAGEIGGAYNVTAAQRKNVTLIHSGARLLDSFKHIKPSVGDKLNKILTEKLHCTVILNDRAELPADAKNKLYINEPMQLQLKSGVTVPSDVVIVCVSGRPNTSFLEQSLPASAFDPSGQIRVSDSLQVNGLNSHVYAIGDAATFQPGWAYYAGEQGKFVGKQIIAQHNNKGTKSMSRLSDVMLIPLGENYGAGQMPVMGTVGSMVVSNIKGKSLFVDKQKSELRLK